MPISKMLNAQKFLGPADTIYDLQPPLYYAIVHLALNISESSLSARAPGVVAGVLSVLGVYLLGNILLSRVVGIISALLFSLLLPPIAFSQSIKHYGLFLFFTIYSFYFLVRSIRSGKIADWLYYTLASLGMLYSGYQGVPCFFAQMAYGVFTYASGPDGAAGFAKRAIFFLGAAALIVLAYLPYFPGLTFLLEFVENPSVNPWTGLGLHFAEGILSGIIARQESIAPFFIIAWSCAFLAGTAACIHWKKRGALGLLALWGASVSLALLCSKSDLRPLLSPRHFASVLPAWVLLVAAGVAWFCERTCGPGLPARARATAFALSAAILTGLLLYPSMAKYEDYYDERLSFDRDLFRWLGANKNGHEAIEFTGSKSTMKSFAMRWYLDGLFDQAGTWTSPGYRRTYVVDTFYRDTSRKAQPLPADKVASFNYMCFTTDVKSIGLANRSPIVVTAGLDAKYQYRDDFQTGSFYQDCHSSNNMTLDVERRMLRPLRYSKPAQALYVFAAPAGTRMKQAMASITWGVFHKHPGSSAGSKITVEVSGDGSVFLPVGVLQQRRPGRADGYSCDFFDEVDFYHSLCSKETFTFEYDPEMLGGDTLYLRLSYEPGEVEGFLFLAGVGLDATLEQPDPAQAALAALERTASNLIVNCNAVAWAAGQRLIGGGVHAFAGPDLQHMAVPGSPVNSMRDLAAFLEENPDAAAAYTLPGRDGHAALMLYDPSPGGVLLSPKRPEATLRPFRSKPARIGGFSLQGEIMAPSLLFGGRQVDIPVVAPFGSALTINPGGKGRISFVPDWTTPEGIKRSVFHEVDVVESRSLQNEINCGQARECSIQYLVASGLPITALRLMVLPHVYSNPCAKCGKNSAKVSLSLDGGKTFEPILNDEGGKQCEWTNTSDIVTRTFDFGKGVSACILRFEMRKGEEAGFISPVQNLDGMYIEATLDASRLSIPDMNGDNVVIRQIDGSTSAFKLYLYEKPQHISDRIVR